MKFREIQKIYEKCEDCRSIGCGKKFVMFFTSNLFYI